MYTEHYCPQSITALSITEPSSMLALLTQSVTKLKAPTGIAQLTQRSSSACKEAYIAQQTCE
eukprot:474020-Karenia_brevis.AAC.1